MSSPKQALYVFVPGKNWKLSLAELMAFFEARKYRFKIADLSKAFFVIASEECLDPSLIDGLGGIIKIGRVMSHIRLETLEDAFVDGKKEAQAEIKANLSADCPIDDIFKATVKKCVFGVSLYFDNPRFLRFSKKIQRFVGSYFKKELLAQGVKARFMGFPKSREAPQLTHVEVLKRNLIEEGAEILFCIGKKWAVISKTVAVHNPFEFQKRDIYRPVQRRIFSMPPRLAKIMVNLSRCLPGKVMLDPFCGVGTILQEAMFLKAQVRGIDIDPWCVKASRLNLEWLKNEYDLTGVRYDVSLGDSSRLTKQVAEETVDCIVTEPDLGPALRHFPTELYARGIVNKLEALYYDFLEEAHTALKEGGTLVLVTPYIRTRSRVFVTLSIKDKAEATGFRRVYPFEKGIFDSMNLLIGNLAWTSTLIDIDRRHKIGREIHVLQKVNSQFQEGVPSSHGTPRER